MVLNPPVMISPIHRDQILNDLSQLNFTSIDFETANRNYNSACSVGIVVVENGSIACSEHRYIKPVDNYFEDFHKRLHGITEDHVANAPSFKEVWEDLLPFVSDKILLVHNSDFDIPIIKIMQDNHGATVTSLIHMCTIKLSCAAFPDLFNYRLDDVAAYFKLAHNHHDALSDARVSAEIGIRAIPKLKHSDFEFEHIELTRRFERIPSRDEKKFDFGFGKKGIESDSLKPNLEGADCNHVFYNKKLVFTGDLKSMTRQEAAIKAKRLGADVNTSISKQTQIVVIGDGAGPVKLEKIESLIEDGFKILILRESDFIKCVTI